MLAQWSGALGRLHPVITPKDVPGTPLVPYGDAFVDGDKVDIPSIDLPAGIPRWMYDDDGWARRVGTPRAAEAEQHYRHGSRRSHSGFVASTCELLCPRSSTNLFYRTLFADYLSAFDPNRATTRPALALPENGISAPSAVRLRWSARLP